MKPLKTPRCGSLSLTPYAVSGELEEVGSIHARLSPGQCCGSEPSLRQRNTLHRNCKGHDHGIYGQREGQGRLFVLLHPIQINPCPVSRPTASVPPVTVARAPWDGVVRVLCTTSYLHYPYSLTARSLVNDNLPLSDPKDKANTGWPSGIREGREKPRDVDVILDIQSLDVNIYYIKQLVSQVKLYVSQQRQRSALGVLFL